MGRRHAGPSAILGPSMTTPTLAVPTGGSRSRRRLLTAAAFVLPALLVYSVFVVIPIIQAVYYSAFKWNGMTPLTDFVGFANYERALTDPDFHSALIHNAIFVILSLGLQIPASLGLALILNGRFRGRAWFRLIFFAPYVLSEVITAAVWQLLLMPDSLVDQTLEGLGLGALGQLWLADRSVVLFTMFVVISWKYFGFHMILMLAGLQGIPRELEEAAAIDGASRRQSIQSITIPLLGPTLRVSVFLSIIGALQLFDLIWVMTGGGPANASNTMATYLFDWGFRRFQLGYGSAVAVILFSISLVIALGYQRWVLRRDTDGAITMPAGG
jgi:raffinose/stachyose/melibiose transport system permease protein